MSLLGAQQAAIDAARNVISDLPGSGVVRVELTPAGGSPRSVSAIRFINESPAAGVQERGGTFAFWLSEVPELLTDGATVLCDGETWTVRTAELGAGLQVAKVWA
jgi:hypothetical protein